MKILAIPGSLRINSSTHVVLGEVAKQLPLGVSLEVFEGIAGLPHFDGPEQLPPSVEEFVGKIRTADGVLICTPEYAFGVPGSLKNALDWTVGTTEMMNKPTALITASTSGVHGHAAMLLILGALSADVGGCELLISSIRSKIKEGMIANAATRDAIAAVVQGLCEKSKQKDR